MEKANATHDEEVNNIMDELKTRDVAMKTMQSELSTAVEKHKQEMEVVVPRYLAMIRSQG